MTKAVNYPGADRASQWAAGRYPGDAMSTNCVVLHTTETTGWPSYSTGYYPNLTYHPGLRKWRQHLPLNRSARALENRAGGVETNTANCVQVELVGTCDKGYRSKYGGIYWPDAPDDALDDLAAFLAFMHNEWGVKLIAPPKWPAYPSSYGNGAGQRMTGQQWRDFYGICGHMHVPENHHGDPGDIDIARLLVKAERLSGGTPVAPTPAPTTGGDMLTADDVWNHRLNPGPTADKVGGYEPGKSWPAFDFLTGADAKLNRLTSDEAARYDDLLANVKETQSAVEGLTALVRDLAAKVEGKPE